MVKKHALYHENFRKNIIEKKEHEALSLFEPKKEKTDGAAFT